MYRPNAEVSRVEKRISKTGVDYVVEFKDGERVHVSREEVQPYMDLSKNIFSDFIDGVQIVTYK